MISFLTIWRSNPKIRNSYATNFKIRRGTITGSSKVKHDSTPQEALINDGK
jgi:hypothetical protein